ncbi:Integrin alpha-6, partial [Eschrichtius robustus]|nr:Integrin alpha-6 [Eschrichtius robustus]
MVVSVLRTLVVRESEGLPADPSSESKEDQWMGVTVQSQGPGGKVVTCAHRYEKRQHVNTKQESRDIFGRCYVLSQNLRIEDDMDGGDWSFCDGRLRGHEKFGSCQQGVAATFTKDFHYIAFGAPGTYNWKGIVRVEQKNNTFFDMNIFEDGPYEVGGETDRDESLVPVPANSYLGFSLDSGKGIVSKDEITFVSGAPRANHSGAVVLLKRDLKSAHLLPEHIFDGEGLASSFGYDVAVVDLNKDGLKVKACFEYTAKPTGYNPSITIAGTLEAEKERRKSGLSSRVQFRNQGSEPKYTQELTLSRQKQKVCMEETLWLQENIRDKLRPIPITASVEIQEPSTRRRVNSLPEVLPILNSNEPKSVHTDVHFLKEGCGDDNVCNSNLKLEYKFCTREGNQDKFSYLPIQKGVPELVLKDQKDIALEITVTNSPSNPKNPTKDGDDAYEAKLIATFPDTLTYSAYRELRAFPEKQLSCVANQNGSQADCELGNPFKRNSSVTFYLILSTTEITFDTTDLDVNLKLETTSNQDNLASITATARVVIELLLSVSGVAKPSQVYFGGSVIGEQAMKSEEEVGSLIEYEFRVINLGKPLKNLGTATLNIQWPKEISNGKWLLYLVKVESKGLEKIACQPQKEINFLKLKYFYYGSCVIEAWYLLMPRAILPWDVSQSYL